MEIVTVVTLRINVTRTWKFEALTQQSCDTNKVDTWVYHCTLCDEVLLVARRFIAPKGSIAVSGVSLSRAELQRIAERAFTLERLLLARAGRG